MSMEPSSETNPEPSAVPPDEGGVSGKLVVLGMLTFGVCLTGFLWLYTYFNNQPFIPLRHALVQKYQRSSSPRVEGGKERGRGPNKLRIVLAVQFDPSEDSAENLQRRAQMERDSFNLAQQHLDLSKYQAWEFILIHYIPEKLPQRWESKREMPEALEELATPDKQRSAAT